MTKEQQDLIWVYLPKEVRNRIISVYFCKTDKSNTLSDYSKGYIDALVHTYGKHNLTSDTEPDEMLMVNRKKVQEYKAEADYNLVRTFSSERFREYWRGQQTALDKLFGNKCMPDKEESVQVEPKFKVGDKVIHNHKNREVGEVAAYFPDEKFCYSVRFGKEYHNMAEHQLLPYVEPTKPKFKVGDIVRVKYIPIYEGEIGIIDEIGSRILEYHLKGNKTLKNDWFAESYLEPYAEPESRNLSQEIANCDKSKDNQLKDNMEEKELNLCELLKGCEGTILYSRAYGDVSLNEIVRDDRPNAQEIKVYTPDPQSDRIWFLRNGRKHKNGEIDLWPSRALYEKYPLDPYSAWMEWKAQRELEFNKPECYITDVNKWWELKVVAKFHSSKEAQQAAEAVRECLEKFHKDHTPKTDKK